MPAFRTHVIWIALLALGPAAAACRHTNSFRTDVHLFCNAFALSGADKAGKDEPERMMLAYDWAETQVRSGGRMREAMSKMATPGASAKQNYELMDSLAREAGVTPCPMAEVLRARIRDTGSDE